MTAPLLAIKIRGMAMRKQAPKPAVTTMRFDLEDWAAIERIIQRNPVIRTNTDAVRYAIHMADRLDWRPKA